MISPRFNIFRQNRQAGKIIFFCALLFVSSCETDNSPVEPEIIERGQLVSITQSASYNVQFLQAYFNSIPGASQTNLKPLYDVDAFKVVYRTADHKGNIVIASGALFIPKGKNNLSLLSLQHGTQSNRSRVGSVNPLNAPEGIIGATLGYFTLVLDYIGLGESKTLHPYHHYQTSASAVVDMIKAVSKNVEKVGKLLNGQIFLAGYSQGGYVTLAAQKEIEANYKNEFAITASAPMAGAYDLDFTARSIIRKNIYDEPSFLAFLITAYDYVYGWNRIKEIFNQPYADRLPALFDGTKTTEEINRELTNEINKLFKQEFLAAYLNGSERELTTALRNNSLINFKPVAPVRLYHGTADEFVPYENSVKARDYFKAAGAEVELFSIPGGTHATSILPSIISAIEWFETIRLKKHNFHIAGLVTESNRAGIKRGFLFR